MTNRWTPKIVGGTEHYPDKPKTSPVDQHGPLNFVFNESDTDTIIETTHPALSEYASTISPDFKPTWEYGPVQRVRDGIAMTRGQYVTEYHDGKHVRTYWVAS